MDVRKIHQIQSQQQKKVKGYFIYTLGWILLTVNQLSRSQLWQLQIAQDM